MSDRSYSQSQGRFIGAQQRSLWRLQTLSTAKYSLRSKEVVG